MNKYLLVNIVLYKKNKKPYRLKSINTDLSKLKSDVYSFSDLYDKFKIEIQFRRKFLRGVDKDNSVIYLPENEIASCSLVINYENGIFLLSCFDEDDVLYEYFNGITTKTEEQYFVNDNTYYENELCFNIEEVIAIINDFVNNKKIDLNKFEEL